jgi:aminoglycoside phosphotransferase family enzyme/predicted kinase
VTVAELIVALSDPRAFPEPNEQVVVCQTHISAVFLSGRYAYKIKKPVHTDFLDFTTLDQRRFYCDEEVRLNRRLAPSVYRGVVPITRVGDRLVVEGPGTAVEWAVKMERLPDEATLEARVLASEARSTLFRTLAERLASFHALAQASPRVAQFGRFETVARNSRENLEATGVPPGHTRSQRVADRLQVLNEVALARLRPLIDERAARGMARECHGDLQLKHIYLFPDRPPPADLAIVDCIEFNDRFRMIDPVADLAFPVMGLRLLGRRDLADHLATTYFEATGDHEGQRLLSFYTAYRAAVRAKVEGMKSAELEVPHNERIKAVELARAHWLLALGELEEVDRRPCLVLIGGLPGAGKSTLARALAERQGFQVIRSDVVRKELAGNVNADLYSAERTQRTYAECQRRAAALLFEGARVIVDASFREDRHRRLFLESARNAGVPGRLFLCQASADRVQERLASRHGDASDANWQVHQHLAALLDPPHVPFVSIDTNGSRHDAIDQAEDELRRLQLIASSDR